MLRGRFSFESVEEGIQKFSVNAGVTDMVLHPDGSDAGSPMGPSPTSPEDSTAGFGVAKKDKSSTSRQRRRAPADLRKRVRSALEGRLRRDAETQNIDVASDKQALVRQNLVSKLGKTLLEYCSRAEYGYGG